MAVAETVNALRVYLSNTPNYGRRKKIQAGTDNWSVKLKLGSLGAGCLKVGMFGLLMFSYIHFSYGLGKF